MKKRKFTAKVRKLVDIAKKTADLIQSIGHIAKLLIAISSLIPLVITWMQHQF